MAPCLCSLNPAFGRDDSWTLLQVVVELVALHWLKSPQIAIIPYVWVTTGTKLSSTGLCSQNPGNVAKHHTSSQAEASLTTVDTERRWFTAFVSTIQTWTKQILWIVDLLWRKHEVIGKRPRRPVFGKFWFFVSRWNEVCCKNVSWNFHGRVNEKKIVQTIC